MRAGVVVVLATLGSAAVAHATPTSVSLTGGPLAVAGPEVHDVAILSVDGTAQVVEAPMKAFALTDARGSGQGWVLYLHATALREWAGTACVAGGAVLPNWSMTLPGTVGDGQHHRLDGAARRRRLPPPRRPTGEGRHRGGG